MSVSAFQPAADFYLTPAIAITLIYRKSFEFAR
jgi:hypothetical protein